MGCARGKKPISGSKNTEEDDSRSQKTKILVQCFLESSFRACASNCIKVDTESLKKFFEADEGASAALSAALEFRRLICSPRVPVSSWRSWACCFCANCFADSGTHNVHIFNDHLDQPSEDMTDFLRGFLQHFPQEWYQNIFDGCWKPIDVASGAVSDSDASLVWADTEREIVLESIAGYLRILLRSGFLHASHVRAVLDYAMAALEINGADGNSMMWLRCLDAPQLKHVQNFLSELSRMCKVDPHAEENSSSDEEDDGKFLDPTDNNMVVLDDNRKSILLYGYNWFIPFDNEHDDVSYNLDSAAVISWLYDDNVTVEDAVKFWTQLESARNKRCVKLIDDYKTKETELRVLCGQNHDWLRYKNALQDLVMIQSFEREQENGDWTIQSFEKILEGWKEKQSEDVLEVFMSAANEILKEAEDIKSSGNWDGDFITKALMKEKEKLILKLHVNAAKAQKNTTVSCRLKERVRRISVVDYLILVIPMVKRFLRAKWEMDAGQKAIVGNADAGHKREVGYADWSEVPRDILFFVCDRLDVQLLRFGAVCRSWHSVVVDHTMYQRQALAPWIVFSHSQHTSPFMFFSLEENRQYSIEQPVDPEARGLRHCLGSAFGWIVTLDGITYNLALINPVLRRRIPLPPLLLSWFSDVIPILRYEESQGLSLCSDNIFEHPQKAMLSSNPEDGEKVWMVVLVFRGCIGSCQLGFCRREDFLWTMVNVPEPIYDVIDYQDEVYALSQRGEIRLWSYSEEGPRSVIIFSPAVPAVNEENLPIFRFLVPSPYGDLFLLWRDHLPPEEMTKIFKVQLEDQQLVETKNLDGLTVFAGLNGPICFPSKDFSKRDCIYFATGLPTQRTFVEIYHTEDGSAEDILPLLGDSCLSRPFPIFFKPYRY